MRMYLPISIPALIGWSNMRKYFTMDEKKEIKRVPDVAGEFPDKLIGIDLAQNTDFTCKELVEVVGEPLSKGIVDGFK